MGSKTVRIKALTIWQPRASLCARGPVGNKRYACMTLPTRYRGPVAIHAHKMHGAFMGRDLEWMKAVAAGLGIGPKPGDLHPNYEGVLRYFDGLPYGAIVGVGMLHDCWEILDDTWKRIPVAEYVLDTWRPGCYAYEFREMQPIEPAIPAKGLPGLWEWDAPEELVDRLEVA